jgi:hypothetical protein
MNLDLRNIDMRIVVPILVVIVILVIAAWAYAKQRRHRQLRERFGPEYDRVVNQYGEPGRAERVLETRQTRVEKLEIKSLPGTARERYAQRWLEVQRRFVDDPGSAVAEADDLVSDVMSARGYPMGDFEQRSADISVNHPRVVENYRAAHDIALRHRRGEASTEDMRRAMVYYRSLFDELLEQRLPERREVA